VDAWLSTILIFLPSPARSRASCLPLGRYATAPFALLVSLVEVGFWIETLTRFDFSQGPAVRAASVLVQRPERLVPRRDVRVLACGSSG
jgi:hypothetical protein